MLGQEKHFRMYQDWVLDHIDISIHTHIYRHTHPKKSAGDWSRGSFTARLLGWLGRDYYTYISKRESETQSSWLESISIWIPPPVDGRCISLGLAPGNTSLSSLRLSFAESPEQPPLPSKAAEKPAFFWAHLSRLTIRDHRGAPKSFHYFRGP